MGIHPHVKDTTTRKLLVRCLTVIKQEGVGGNAKNTAVR
nr:MAG TPA: hypothetical protein [Caudoviricetes sp.]